MLISALFSKIKTPLEHVEQNKDCTIPLSTERAIKTSSCTQLKASLEAEAMINLGDFGEPWLCPRWAPNSPADLCELCLPGQARNLCGVCIFPFPELPFEHSWPLIHPLSVVSFGLAGGTHPWHLLVRVSMAFPSWRGLLTIPHIVVLLKCPRNSIFYKDKRSHGWNSQRSHKKKNVVWDQREWSEREHENLGQQQRVSREF